MASYKKDINLLAAMTKKKSRVSPLALIVPILVFLALGAAIAFSLYSISTQVANLTMQRDDLQRYMDSARVVDGQAEASSLRSQAEQVQSLATEVRGTLYNLSSYPDLTGEDFQAVFDLAGYDVELTHFTYDRRTGALNFSASCESVRRMPIFIQSLRGCGIFSDVQYTGYANDIRTETGSPILDPVSKTTTFETWEVSEYRYEVSCLVAYPAPALPPLPEAPAESTDDGTATAEGGEE
jgi:hypothetical protein